MRLFLSKKSRRSFILPDLYWISLQNIPILEQLQLEEALLRSDARSFCIVNVGSPRSIIMGISGDPKTLIDLPRAKEAHIPIIKRFSGGGTVIVDEETLFITFIMAKKDCAVHPFPEPILRWSADLYRSAWQIPGFHLRENDYVIGSKKCGGNAQYICKDRWVHHTSYLWDYEEKNMEYLLLPAKRPAYRGARAHNDFLCRLKECGGTVEERLAQLRKALEKGFCVRPFPLASWEALPHRQATHIYPFHLKSAQSKSIQILSNRIKQRG
ncbi:MAG: lipoate--protein ligase family protein [Chlamydiia bacterium]|nr:lipoate--protein ligase family protein [Chlamydiia bacterium]